MSDIFKR